MFCSGFDLLLIISLFSIKADDKYRKKRVSFIEKQTTMRNSKGFTWHKGLQNRMFYKVLKIIAISLKTCSLLKKQTTNIDN